MPESLKRPQGEFCTTAPPVSGAESVGEPASSSCMQQEGIAREQQHVLFAILSGEQPQSRWLPKHGPPVDDFAIFRKTGARE